MIYSLGDKKINRDNADFWVAPSASVIGDITLKKNASVWFGAVLRGDNDPIIVGENCFFGVLQKSSIFFKNMGNPAPGKSKNYPFLQKSRESGVRGK